MAFLQLKRSNIKVILSTFIFMCPLDVGRELPLCKVELNAPFILFYLDKTHLVCQVFFRSPWHIWLITELLSSAFYNLTLLQRMVWSPSPSAFNPSPPLSVYIYFKHFRSKSRKSIYISPEENFIRCAITECFCAFRGIESHSSLCICRYTISVLNYWCCVFISPWLCFQWPVILS